jgi:hypothetical protein
LIWINNRRAAAVIDSGIANRFWIEGQAPTSIRRPIAGRLCSLIIAQIDLDQERTGIEARYFDGTRRASEDVFQHIGRGIPGSDSGPAAAHASWPDFKG